MAPPPALSSARVIAVSLIGFAVEFTWAMGEATIIPFLEELGLQTDVAGLIFLTNPIFSLPLAPLLGRWSDRCTGNRLGRRRPFLIGLTIIGIGGIVILVGAARWARAAGVGGVATLTFVGFTLSDCAHDLLLGPGRALLGDMLAAAHARAGDDGGDGDDRESRDREAESQRLNSYFSTLQFAGRLTAL